VVILYQQFSSPRHTNFSRLQDEFDLRVSFENGASAIKGSLEYKVREAIKQLVQPELRAIVLDYEKHLLEHDATNEKLAQDAVGCTVTAALPCRVMLIHNDGFIARTTQNVVSLSYDCRSVVKPRLKSATQRS
jgi:hypothetical protein